ncbi:heterokaryon incompatibility protein-domain-containing protein [Phyllosticta capitalensis]
MEGAATSQLQYKPLNASEYEARFLNPIGRSDAGLLSYKLETHSLTRPPEYVALSYVWYEKGNDDRTKSASIIVDGIHVSVTSSLAEALRYTSWPKARWKKKNRERPVWADQICINQSDLEERGQQVQLMGKIYASAAGVHVWLGSASHDSDRAMEACRRLFEADKGRKKKQKEKDGNGGDKLDAQEKDAIAALIKRPYFERVWIIQEIAKNDRRLLLCGDHTAQWTGLEKALEQLPQHAREPSESLLLMNALMSFRLGELHGRLAMPRMLLMQALLESRRSRATEPRDKIYALLGLTRDGAEVVPAPHYTGGDALIYTQVARHFVKRQGHTAAILLAARTEERAGLPSWVPNWGHWSAEVPPWVMRAVKAERESLEIWRRYKVNQQRLTVPGVQLERIERCADAASVGDLRKYHVSLGIGELEYFSMKIALSAHGRPRVVHQNACPGDYICRLENCTLPVVLRRVSKDDFKYVGEVLREEKDDTERYWADFGFEKGMKMDEIVIG